MKTGKPWLLLGLTLMAFWPRVAWSNVSRPGVVVSPSANSVPHPGLARLGDFATLFGMHPKAVVATQTSFANARGRHSGLSVSALHKPVIHPSAHVATGAHVVSRGGTVHTASSASRAHFQVVKTSASSAQVVQSPLPILTTGTAPLAAASASTSAGVVSGTSLMSHGSPVVHTTATDPPPGTFNGPTFSRGTPLVGGLTPGIPEPSAILLLGTGGLILSAYRLRRKRQEDSAAR